jgi:hypothetical protein
MDTTVLPTEEFDAKKELADIGLKIAEGAAALQKLKDETEAYTLDREHEVMERVQTILAESHEALKQVSDNKDALQHYAEDLTTFASLLGELLTEYRALREVMVEKADSDSKQLEKTSLALSEDRKALAVLAGTVAADRESNRKEREWIGQETLKIRDERETLKRAFNRLK